jgi:hypothetical protein
MGKKYRFVAYLFLFSLSGIIYGCHSVAKRPLPDVSHIEVNVHIHRFDLDLSMLDTNHVMKNLPALFHKYPVFLPVYLNEIMNYGVYNDNSSMLKDELHSLLTSKDILGLQDTLKAHFQNLDWLEKQLDGGFRYLKYYYPDYHIPKCVTFYSGLNNFGAVTIDTVLGIGLDMFLGKNYPFYGQVADPYPEYMLPRFAPQYISTDCFKSIEQQMYPTPQEGTLLSQMIDAGKQLYFLDQVLPDEPDSIKTGFTQKQLDWCRNNEKQIWQYFVQSNLLYIRDMQQIIHYVGDGPSTQGMPPQAPGNIGSWVGWQIVKKYMQNHPEVTLEQLMQMKDAQQILTDAHYRP